MEGSFFQIIDLTNFLGMINFIPNWKKFFVEILRSTFFIYFYECFLYLLFWKHFLIQHQQSQPHGLQGWSQSDEVCLKAHPNFEPIWPIVDLLIAYSLLPWHNWELHFLGTSRRKLQINKNESKLKNYYYLLNIWGNYVLWWLFRILEEMV